MMRNNFSLLHRTFFHIHPFRVWSEHIILQPMYLSVWTHLLTHQKIHYHFNFSLKLSNKRIALGCILCMYDCNHYVINLISAQTILNLYFDRWWCLTFWVLQDLFDIYEALLWKRTLQSQNWEYVYKNQLDQRL